MTRRNWLSLTGDERNRFFNAVDTMMKNVNEPGSSSYFDISKIHGLPAPIYCQHGTEAFPGWHRVYVYEFEKLLQQADKLNGKDGTITLPYWDWGARDATLPDGWEDKYTSWPQDFWSTEFLPTIEKYHYTKNVRATPQEIKSNIQSSKIEEMVNASLELPYFWQFATVTESNESLERPHNFIHGITGGQHGVMSVVPFAAFDPIFFLHHCNVDRIFERYLQINPDSRNQLKEITGSYQLTPFKNDVGSYYTVADTFDGRHFNSFYDQLPGDPGLRSLRRGPQTLFLFQNVKTTDFNGVNYSIHLFADNDQKENMNIKKYSDMDFTKPNYLGGISTFGRAATECATCRAKPPIDYPINITNDVQRLKLTRADLTIQQKLKYYIFEIGTNNDTPINIKDTAWPQPIVSGPGYEKSHNNQSLNNNLMKLNFAEISNLSHVERFSQIDDFVKRSDLRRKRGEKAYIFDRLSGKELVNINNNVISYSIEKPLSYLNEKSAIECIQLALNEWSNASNGKLNFKKVDDEQKSIDIVFKWSAIKKPYQDLSAGGTLGKFQNGSIEFDLAEKWVINLDEKPSDLFDVTTWKRTSPLISLYSVSLHAIGRALGIHDSPNPNDVMYKYYNPNNLKLTENDKSLLLDRTGDNKFDIENVKSWDNATVAKWVKNICGNDLGNIDGVDLLSLIYQLKPQEKVYSRPKDDSD